MQLVDALVRVLMKPEVNDAMSALVEWMTTFSAEPNVSIFMLSTQKAAFLGVFGTQKGVVQEVSPEYQESRHALCKRGNVVIAFVEWDMPIVGLGDEDRGIINAVLDEIYRRFYVNGFFLNIRRPIDFTNQETYFRETARLLSDTLSMQIVAIRQINLLNNLECRAFFSYSEKFDDMLEFEWGNMPPPFVEVITETRRLLEAHSAEQLSVKFEIVDPDNTERYGFLFNDQHLSKVKAFAVFPIVFGNEFFGVASCATTVPFLFSELEKTTIETAMQIIGVAMSNFSMFHEARRMADVIHDQLFSATELEIAQSARHELQNIEAEQALHMDELFALTKNLKEKGIGETLAKLKNTVSSLGASIAKLRYSGVHVAPKLQETSVAKVWDEAVDLIQERLKTLGIKSKYVGPNLEGYYYPDWLREAFLNLLFNSIDAFRDRPRQNRSISLVVQKESEASLYHILDYSDTAGGITFGKLAVPEPIKEANPGMGPEQLIFQPKVTSKKGQKGAGWGLYLVRQAFRLHNGSISLRANSKDGCTFRIQLRKDLKEQITR